MVSKNRREVQKWIIQDGYSVEFYFSRNNSKKVTFSFFFFCVESNVQKLRGKLNVQYPWYFIVEGLEWIGVIVIL